MSIESLKNALPDYARDMKINVGNLANEAALDEQQRAGAFVAAAYASRNVEVAAAIEAEFAPKLSPDALKAAKAVATVMAMNNVYYRFTHLVSAGDYRDMPAKLRMNGLSAADVDKKSTELWALVVSAINGCGACMDAHERQLRDHGMSAEAIQAAVRIGAVVASIAATLAARPRQVATTAELAA